MKPYHYYQYTSNKFDSFDTKVSEAIELFLLPKILAEQGLSAFFILGLVSLWSVGTELNTAKQVFLRHKTNHAGYLNGTTESDIINDGPQCPNCDSFLKKQSYYRGYEDDWTCEECGSKLHRDYGCDSYVVVYEEGGARCPNCDAALNDQYSFHRWKKDYVCDGCGAKLHRRSDDEPFSVIVEEQRPECPNCGACLEDQEDYYSFEDDWICEECGAKLHRDFSFKPYEIVYEDEYDDDCDDDLDEDEDDSNQEQYQAKREHAVYSKKRSKARKIV